MSAKRKPQRRDGKRKNGAGVTKKARQWRRWHRAAAEWEASLPRGEPRPGASGLWVRYRRQDQFEAARLLVALAKLLTPDHLRAFERDFLAGITTKEKAGEEGPGALRAVLEGARCLGGSVTRLIEVEAGLTWRRGPLTRDESRLVQRTLDRLPEGIRQHADMVRMGEKGADEARQYTEHACAILEMAHRHTAKAVH